MKRSWICTLLGLGLLVFAFVFAVTENRTGPMSLTDIGVTIAMAAMGGGSLVLAIVARKLEKKLDERGEK